MLEWFAYLWYNLWFFEPFFWVLAAGVFLALIRLIYSTVGCRR